MTYNWSTIKTHLNNTNDDKKNGEQQKQWNANKEWQNDIKW